MWKNINKKTQVVGLGWIDCADNKSLPHPKTQPSTLFIFAGA
jgi:hypothetical protein